MAKTPETVGKTIRCAEKATFDPFLIKAGGVIVPFGDGIEGNRRVVRFSPIDRRVPPVTEITVGYGLISAAITSPLKADSQALIALGLTNVRGLRGQKLPDQLYFGILGEWDFGPVGQEGGEGCKTRIAIGFDSEPIKSFTVHIPGSNWLLSELEGLPTRLAIQYAINHGGTPRRWLDFLDHPFYSKAAPDLRDLIRDSAQKVLA